MTDRQKQREREDLLDAMGEAHRAHDAAVQSGDLKAIAKAREAACDAARAYHESKLRGREDAALAAKAGA